MSLREEEKLGSSCPNQPNSKRSGNRQKKVVKWLKHYSSDHRILLVGEGDFSFSLSLGMAFGDASNIVATSLDSYDVVINKYKGAKTNLEILHSLGAQLLHEVDALQMKLHRDLQMQKFDRIIFNFPHAGFLGREDDQWVIKKHRNLVCGFYKNASGMLHPKGEVHVTHKTSDPFQSWNIEELATQNSLILLERIEFKLKDYPGYSNKRGDGNRSDESFPLGECSTYKFVLFSNGDSSKEDGLCYCDPPLRKVEHVCWSKKNPNRRFMGCPKYGGPESAHCKSIDWIDPPLSGWYKKAMSELHLIRHERDEKEKLMKSLTHQRKEKEAEIEALVEEKIQNEKLMETLKSQNKEMYAYKEKLMESLTHQRKEKEAAIEALTEEKIQNEKLMETLKSRDKETDAYREKLMESLTRQRNEKEAAIEALAEEKIQKKKLMEILKSLNTETDAYREKLMESLIRQRNEKEAAIEALAEEKIQKKKLMEILKSLNTETDAYREKLMESLIRQRNEKEAAIEALLEEKFQNEMLMETLKSRDKEIDAYKIWRNDLYKRCLMAVLVVGYWWCRSKKR